MVAVQPGVDRKSRVLYFLNSLKTIYTAKLLRYEIVAVIGVGIFKLYYAPSTHHVVGVFPKVQGYQLKCIQHCPTKVIKMSVAVAGVLSRLIAGIILRT